MSDEFPFEILFWTPLRGTDEQDRVDGETQKKTSMSSALCDGRLRPYFEHGGYNPAHASNSVEEVRASIGLW